VTSPIGKGSINVIAALRSGLSSILFGTFAFLAVSLAAVGIYGLTSYSVSQRTQEVGIRVALGAQQGEILRLIVGQHLGRSHFFWLSWLSRLVISQRAGPRALTRWSPCVTSDYVASGMHGGGGRR
jgi:hypothetical protein